MSARTYKKYAEYKDSGVEWLGEIPAGWEVKRLRFVSDSNPVPCEVRGLPGDTEVSFVPMEAVGEQGGLNLDATKLLADVKAGYTYFRNGDVVIAKITPCFENGKGALAEGLRSGIAFGTTELHVLRARNTAIPRFAFYITLSDAFRRIGEADMYGAGGQKRISESFVRDFPIAVPARKEQRAIAAFLDRETARIDALVAKKERLIALLQERRTALITRAVTKGLDSAAPMKDSGVEWLGEIPAHWEVLKSTWLFSIGSGTTPSSDYPAYFNGDTPWVTTSELRESEIWSTEKSVSKLAIADYSSLKVHPSGSIAVAMYGATIGRLGILRVPAATNQACCVFSDPKGVDPHFWYYWLQMYRPFLISLGYGGGQPNLSQDLLRSIRVPVPPMSEQLRIVEVLAAATDRVDCLIGKSRHAITHLHELRTALISAAVTGKIDVREAATS